MNMPTRWTSGEPDRRVEGPGRYEPIGSRSTGDAGPRDLATSTGRLAGNGDPDPGALAGDAVDLGPAAQALGPLPEVVQALAGAGRPRRVKPLAVVVHLQHPAGLGPVQRHPAGGGLGMPTDIGEGLAGQLDHVAGLTGQFGRHLRVDLGDGDHAGALLELLAQTLQGLVELAVGEDAGAQPEDVVAQIPDDPVHLLHGVLEATAQLLAGRQRGRALQTHADRKQGLDGAVVQLLRSARGPRAGPGAAAP